MNTITKAANAAYSLVSFAVFAVLAGLFIYWAVLQRPFLDVNTERTQQVYTVNAGTILYMENPVIPAEFAGKVDYTGTLISTDQSTRYSLPSPDVARREVAELGGTTKVIPDAKPAAPLYAVFIPSYVRPGTYKYAVTATYQLNPFKTARLDLPVLTITVE